MLHDFQQLEWNDDLIAAGRALIRLGIQEDLRREYDWTTVALVPAAAAGRAALVSRRPGIVAGLPLAELTLSEIDPRVVWRANAKDGDAVRPGQTLATIAGPARSLLTAERLLLNFVGRLSGIATLTGQYVEAVRGTQARLYDTRKTTPGWRLLEKYAVRCGGGRNHRTGLFDAILIKDNHLAFGAEGEESARFSPTEAVLAARAFLADAMSPERSSQFLIEIEVDALDQLAQVLPTLPDIVLLDNMSLEQLRAAVALRDSLAPKVELEASGGVCLETVGDIARTGVDRISVGALTHSAVGFDVGLDWL